jgi:LAO/AO transport system kinase
MTDTREVIGKLKEGDIRTLARAISVVENELPGYAGILAGLDLSRSVPVVGITGPPGAGKSSLVNALIRNITDSGKKVAVIAVDPTSPFNFGSLLGDRLRMSEHFNNPHVYIRSLATRGSLGGLSARILEVVDVVRASVFDYIFVETVGVGQSEVEISGLADTTVVVMVPEAGDEIQTIKSGIMEIADIFVVNKADRAGADSFAQSLQQLVHSHRHKDWTEPVLKTCATKEEGIEALIRSIQEHTAYSGTNDRKAYLLTEKALRLIQNQKMRNVDRQKIHRQIRESMLKPDFNLYAFVDTLLCDE